MLSEGIFKLSHFKAAAAAHMAVQCQGKRRVCLRDDAIIVTASETQEDPTISRLDVIKAASDAETSRKIDVLPPRHYF